MKWAALSVFLVISVIIQCAPVYADELTDSRNPALHITTNKNLYEAGERGFIVVRLDTYGKMDSAEIEMEILSSSGRLVEGDIIYTTIPSKTTVNTDTKQTEQTFYDESVTYFGEEKTIYRVIDFEIPLDTPEGTYSITARVTAPGIFLKEQEMVQISGPGGFVNFIFVAYAAVLLCAIYLLRRS